MINYNNYQQKKHLINLDALPKGLVDDLEELDEYYSMYSDKLVKGVFDKITTRITNTKGALKSELKKVEKTKDSPRVKNEINYNNYQLKKHLINLDALPKGLVADLDELDEYYSMYSDKLVKGVFDKITTRITNTKGALKSDKQIVKEVFTEYVEEQTKKAPAKKVDDVVKEPTIKDVIRKSKSFVRFLPTNQRDILTSSDEFIDVVERNNKQLAKLPEIYAQDELGKKAIVYAKYFSGGGSTWFITEAGTGVNSDELFGYAILNADYQNSENGYLSLDELKDSGSVELDLHWTPKTLEQALNDVSKSAYPMSIDDIIDDIIESDTQGILDDVPFVEGQIVQVVGLPKEVKGQKNPYYNLYGEVINYQSDDVRIRLSNGMEDGFLEKNVWKTPYKFLSETPKAKKGKVFEYHFKRRGFSIGTYPLNDDFIEFVEDDTIFGKVTYSKELSLDDVKKYELEPTTKVLELAGKQCWVKLGKELHQAKILSDKNRVKNYTFLYLEMWHFGKKEWIKSTSRGTYEIIEEIESGKIVFKYPENETGKKEPEIDNDFGGVVVHSYSSGDFDETFKKAPAKELAKFEIKREIKEIEKEGYEVEKQSELEITYYVKDDIGNHDTGIVKYVDFKNLYNVIKVNRDEQEISVKGFKTYKEAYTELKKFADKNKDEVDEFFDDSEIVEAYTDDGKVILTIGYGNGAKKPKAPAKNKAKTKVDKKVSHTEVAHYGNEFMLLRRLYNLISKNSEVPFRKIQLLYMAFQKASLQRKVRISSDSADLYTKSNKKIVTLYNAVKSQKDDADIEIKDKAFLNELKNYVASQKVNSAITLLNSFISMQGYKPEVEKAKNLLKRITSALEKNRINKKNRLYNELVKAQEELTAYIQSPKNKIVPEIVGLSRPARKKKSESLNGTHELEYDVEDEEIATEIETDFNFGSYTTENSFTEEKKTTAKEEPIKEDGRDSNIINSELLENKISDKKTNKKNAKGIISTDELMNMQFETLPFTGKWAKFLENPPKNMQIAIWGKPKNGKTSSACQFANYLTNFGNVLYNFADQGINASTQKIWKLAGLDKNNKASLSSARTLDELEDICKTGNHDFVFIDMINTYIARTGMKSHEFEDRFMKKYPNISFILVFEVTKSGNFKGDQSWTHLPDVLVTVEDYVMYATGRYGMGHFVGWEDGLKKQNPKKYKELFPNGTKELNEVKNDSDFGFVEIN